MLNAQEFRGWYYGLNNQGLNTDKINLLPMSDKMVEQMTEENNPKYDLKIVYIFTEDKQRLLHILQREEKPDCKEVCRRFLTDIDDYNNNDRLWSCCYIAIENNYNDNFYFNLPITAGNCFEGDEGKII